MSDPVEALVEMGFPRNRAYVHGTECFPMISYIDFVMNLLSFFSIALGKSL
jgi:hypothetical protein